MKEKQIKKQYMKNSLYNKYFDNAATSFPKPKEVADEVSRYLNEAGGTYGRSKDNYFYDGGEEGI